MATKFVSEINSHLLCPKCKQLLSEPVINIHCGHTLCKKCFIENDNAGEPQKTSSTKCPIDSVSCSSSSLVINRALLSQIEDLLIYCKYGFIWDENANDWIRDEDGCHEAIKYADRSTHEDHCEFQLVQCPFNALHCGQFRNKNLQHHIQGCTNVPCPYKEKGCGFLSSHDVVESHKETCGFRGEQQANAVLMLSMQENMLSLQEKNVALEAIIKQTQCQMKQLEESNNMLTALVHSQNRAIESLTKNFENIMDDVNRLKTQQKTYGVESSSHSSLRRRTSSSSSMTGIAASNSPRIESWTMPFQFKCIGTLRGHQDAVRGLVTKKNLLFSCGDDHVIKVWDLEALTKGCVKTLSGHKDSIHCVAAGDTYLYSGGEDGCLTVWNISDLSVAKVIENAHANVIAALLCSEEYIISSSYTMIKIWQCSTLEEVHVIKGLHHWVRALALNKTQDKLYSGNHNTIEIWDCTGKFNLVGKISHSYGSVHSLTVTPEYIIAGTYNQNIHMFDVKTQSYVTKLSGHLGVITCIKTSVSGRFMFTSSTDNSVQIWNLENKLPIQNLKRHEGYVNAIVLHHDLLLSASEDKEIKVFKYFKMQPGFTPS